MKPVKLTVKAAELFQLEDLTKWPGSELQLGKRYVWWKPRDKEQALLAKEDAFERTKTDAPFIWGISEADRKVAHRAWEVLIEACDYEEMRE